MVEAENGVQGLRRLFAEPIDLVILDWDMAEMNGLQFVQMIRANDAYRDLPIVTLTKASALQEGTTAIEAGTNGYLVKPFNGQILKKKIAQLVG